MVAENAGEHGLGRDFPRPFARLLLLLLIPTQRREELVGDLIEEAETVVLASKGRAAARRWFWRQAVASASPLYSSRTKREISMNRWKWLTLVALLVAGPLMALDPGVFGASPGVIALVVFAILVPAVAGLLSGNLHVLAGAAVASGFLLLAARLVSGIEIRWYAMAFIFFVVLRIGWWFERRPAAS